MTDPLRVTLSGDLGSGKSSVGRRIAAALGVPYFSAGALFREMGRIDNLDALNTNLAAENNTAIDFAVDQRTREIDSTVASFVIDSRMAWHFVRNATKVYLTVSRETAAHRIMGDSARSGETYPSHAAAVAALGERRSSERKRYRQLYGVDITDPANYDLVIATDDADVTEVADLVLAAARREVSEKLWLPTARVVPLVAWDDAATRASGSATPLPLAVVHNFGFYSGDAGTLAAALGNPRPFLPYLPLPVGDGEAMIARAKRGLTPGGLGQWVERAGVGRAFADLLEPARP